MPRVLYIEGQNSRAMEIVYLLISGLDAWKKRRLEFENDCFIWAEIFQPIRLSTKISFHFCSLEFTAADRVNRQFGAKFEKIFSVRAYEHQLSCERMGSSSRGLSLTPPPTPNNGLVARLAKNFFDKQNPENTCLRKNLSFSSNKK